MNKTIIIMIVIMIKDISNLLMSKEKLIILNFIVSSNKMQQRITYFLCAGFSFYYTKRAFALKALLEFDSYFTVIRVVC